MCCKNTTKKVKLTLDKLYSIVYTNYRMRKQRKFI